MSEQRTSYDAVVIGGGPCGSVLSLTLADWGRRVALVDSGARGGAIPEETLVPAAAPIISRNGLLASIRAHDFVGTRRHGIVWGDGTIRVRDNSPEQRGFKVDRAILDADLRRMAGGRNVDVFDGHSAVGPLPEEGRGPVQLRRPDGSSLTLSAEVIVVATGKSVGARLLPLSLERQLSETFALTSILDPGAQPVDCTFIESVPEGWLWWLPLRTGAVALTLFTDADELRRCGSRTQFTGACRNASGPARLLEPQLQFGNNATARLLSSRSGCLLAGDARSSIDPLSSQGIEKALASAESAAVAVNTILDRPDTRGRVLEHQSRWERDLWLAHARQTLRLYLEEARFSDRPFWSRRHESVRVEFESNDPDGLPQFVRLVPGIARRPGLRRRGRRLEDVQGFGLEGATEVFDRIGRVPVAPLVAMLERSDRVDDLLTSAANDADLFLLTRNHIVQALTELLRLGIIEPSR